jgi:hypothetical protein
MSGARGYGVEPRERKALAEVKRLTEILNTPVVEPFMQAAVAEAKHQRFRWGDEADALKTAWDWFWCLGYLGGKAAHAALAGDHEKALHHTITAAAMLANWHRHIVADRDRRQAEGRTQ